MQKQKSKASKERRLEDPEYLEMQRRFREEGLEKPNFSQMPYTNLGEVDFSEIGVLNPYTKLAEPLTYNLNDEEISKELLKRILNCNSFKILNEKLGLVEFSDEKGMIMLVGTRGIEGLRMEEVTWKVLLNSLRVFGMYAFDLYNYFIMSNAKISHFNDKLTPVVITVPDHFIGIDFAHEYLFPVKKLQLISNTVYFGRFMESYNELFLDKKRFKMKIKATREQYPCRTKSWSNDYEKEFLLPLADLHEEGIYLDDTSERDIPVRLMKYSVFKGYFKMSEECIDHFETTFRGFAIFRASNDTLKGKLSYREPFGYNEDDFISSVCLKKAFEFVHANETIMDEILERFKKLKIPFIQVGSITSMASLGFSDIDITMHKDFLKDLKLIKLRPFMGYLKKSYAPFFNLIKKIDLMTICYIDKEVVNSKI